MNDMSGAQRASPTSSLSSSSSTTRDVGGVVVRLCQIRPVRPRDNLRFHLEALDLTPLHRRPERLHDLGDHPV